TRKAAISPRVTKSSGRYVPSPYPTEISRAARRSTAPKYQSSGPTSEKVADGAATGGSPSERMRKAAISARVTARAGQKRSPTGSQPWVRPAVPIASIADSWTEPSSSTNVPPAAVTAPAGIAITTSNRIVPVAADHRVISPPNRSDRGYLVDSAVRPVD